MSAGGTAPQDFPPASGARPPVAPPSPLNEAQFAVVREAAAAFKSIKRATRIAQSSSFITLFFALAAAPVTMLWPSIAGVLITLGLFVIGSVEFIGHRRMQRADPTAARFLATNQLAFLGLIIVYCLIQMLTFSTEAAKAEALSPEVRAQLNEMPEMAGSIDSIIEKWAPLVTYGFYGLVIVLSILFQGGMAWYYFSRRKFLEAFQRQPAWVRRLLVEGSPQTGA
jgi:hypothetical protein